MSTGNKATEAVKRRYNRIAPLYDPVEGLIEGSRTNKWREQQWSKVEGSPPFPTRFVA